MAGSILRPLPARGSVRRLYVAKLAHVEREFQFTTSRIIAKQRRNKIHAIPTELDLPHCRRPARKRPF